MSFLLVAQINWWLEVLNVFSRVWLATRLARLMWGKVWIASQRCWEAKINMFKTKVGAHMINWFYLLCYIFQTIFFQISQNWVWNNCKHQYAVSVFFVIYRRHLNSLKLYSYRTIENKVSPFKIRGFFCIFMSITVQIIHCLEASFPEVGFIMH